MSSISEKWVGFRTLYFKLISDLELACAERDLTAISDTEFLNRIEELIEQNKTPSKDPKSQS
jgi:hypothetical protein